MDREARQAIARTPLRIADWGLRIAIVTAVAVYAVSAQTATTIKLATLVPTNSIWDKNLKQMGEEFKQATAGRFEITVYSGGTQGDESTVLRKMRLDALQAGAFTNTGLGIIDPSFNVFNTPFFFESYDELNYVVTKLTPTLKKRAEAKGFILLNWGHGGWTQVFTKKPVHTVADMKEVKLWTSAGNDNMVQWYKANGFQPRAMATTDITTGLTTGMIDGLPTTPLAASLFQWYRQTPYMLEIGLAPIVGAGVITVKAWKAIPEADRAKLVAAGEGVEKRLQAEVPKLDADAVTAMTKAGLSVTKPTDAEWRKQFDNLAKTMRGEQVPPDIFDLASKARDEFRKNKKPAAAK